MSYSITRAIQRNSQSKYFSQRQNWSTTCPNTGSEPPSWEDYPLESVSFYKTVDLLGEGEISGLSDANGQVIKLSSDITKNEDGFKGILLNNVPIKNTNSNTLNYQRVFADFRSGTQWQNSLSQFDGNDSLSFNKTSKIVNVNISLPGLNKENSESDLRNISSIESRYVKKILAIKGNFVQEISLSEDLGRIKNLEKAQIISANHIIQDQNVDSVKINMTNERLFRAGDTGVSLPAATNFVIKVGYEGDELTKDNGGSVTYLFCGVAGISTSGYQRTFEVLLPPSVYSLNRFVKVFRVDIEPSFDKIDVSKSLAVSSIVEVIDVNLTFPYSSVVGMFFDARAFSGIPKRTFDCKLSKVFIPTNYDSEAKFYKGNWDGNFSLVKKWTDNPAWIFYDLITNDRYGAGKFNSKKQFVDKWNLYSIAKYCDELVPTGYSGRYASIDFSIDPGGVTVSIDDSSSAIGEEGLKARFPNGGIICLSELKDSNSSDVRLSYKRLIVYEDSTPYSSNTFSFRLVRVPSVDYVFEVYPDIKASYLASISSGSEAKTAQQYIINLLVNNKLDVSSSLSYVNDYLVGEPINSSVVSGKATTQFIDELPFLEPRFSCNILLNEPQNVFNALSDLAAIFRGILYWGVGNIFLSQDKKKNPVMIFNNSNVKDGVFTYSGSSETSRTTVVKISYNDAANNYEPSIEYLEDKAGIRKFGYKEKEILGFGITSRSQAKRLAKWFLYTNQTESDAVQFSTGQEGSFLRPGDVIKIQDEIKTSKRYGGRIIEIDYGAKTVTLDKGIEEDIVGQTITFSTPQNNLSLNDINNLVVENDYVSDAELENFRKPQITSFTISSVLETNVVSITEVNEQDFNLIEKGFVWSVENTNPQFEIEEVEYRVLSSSESNQNEYSITAMTYNRSKFDAIDRSESLEPNQFSLPQIETQEALPETISNLSSLTTSIFNVAYQAFVNNLVEYDSSFELVGVEYQGSVLIDYDTPISYMVVDFSQVVSDNNWNQENTGGYQLAITKENGDSLDILLDGYDNNLATIVLGVGRPQDFNVGVGLSRYDQNWRLNNGIERNV